MNRIEVAVKSGGKAEKRASPSSSVPILPNDHGHFDEG